MFQVRDNDKAAKVWGGPPHITQTAETVVNGTRCEYCLYVSFKGIAIIGHQKQVSFKYHFVKCKWQHLQARLYMYMYPFGVSPSQTGGFAPSTIVLSHTNSWTSKNDL